MRRAAAARLTRRALPLALATGLPLASALQAQTVLDCASAPSSAAMVAEPWETSRRLFANGRIRLILLDTGEPACCSHYLVVQVPDPDQGYWGCAVVAQTPDGLGYAEIGLAAATATYSPATGLDVTLPVRIYVDGINDRRGHVTVRLNQATGTVFVP